MKHLLSMCCVKHYATYMRKSAKQERYGTYPHRAYSLERRMAIGRVIITCERNYYRGLNLAWEGGMGQQTRLPWESLKMRTVETLLRWKKSYGKVDGMSCVKIFNHALKYRKGYIHGTWNKGARVGMNIRNCIRQNPVIHAEEFFLYYKSNEPLEGFKTERNDQICRFKTC